ncbi:hypothetical protein BSL78_20033 [Apostichopus japonicus]|uniref:CCHC-type domain-containing protein n=1 Tax=Stichopus japonicus TaxID=307972 RepID=A0A2G8K527_STIJA|nr:hypothetical protein BSL78_20033 [Apostichopus japonicus]
MILHGICQNKLNPLKLDFNTRFERLENQAARKGTFTKRPKRGKSEIKCRRCQEMGHYASECPSTVVMFKSDVQVICSSQMFKSDVQVGGILVVRLAKPGSTSVGMNVLKHCSLEQLAQLLELPSTHQSPVRAKVVQGVVKVAGRGKVRIPARSAIVMPVTGPICSAVSETSPNIHRQ